MWKTTDFFYPENVYFCFIKKEIAWIAPKQKYTYLTYPKS